MDADADERATGVARRATEYAREQTAQLSSVLARIAQELEQSAGLADEHADRRQLAGRRDDAALERQVAVRARDAAERAHARASEYLKRAAGWQR